MLLIASTIVLSHCANCTIVISEVIGFESEDDHQYQRRYPYNTAKVDINVARLKVSEMLGIYDKDQCPNARPYMECGGVGM